MTDDRLDGLNYLATIQHDLEQCRQGASSLYSEIDRKITHIDGIVVYDATQDRAALKVIRTRIDALQARLDRYIGESYELGAGPGRRELANQAYNLNEVIGDYIGEYFYSEAKK